MPSGNPGVPRHKPRGELHAEWRRMIVQGMSLVEVGRAFGVSKQAVWNAIRDYRCRTRHRRKPKDDAKEARILEYMERAARKLELFPKPEVPDG